MALLVDWFARHHHPIISEDHISRQAITSHKFQSRTIKPVDGGDSKCCGVGLMARLLGLTLSAHIGGMHTICVMGEGRREEPHGAETNC